MPAVRIHRLKTRSQFQAVLAGLVIAKTDHFAMHCRAIDIALVDMGESEFSTNVWVGAMIPKRWAKKAVTRNTVKRQIYCVASGLSNQFPEAAFLVRLKREFSRSIFTSASSPALKKAVRAELEELFKFGLSAR